MSPMLSRRAVIVGAAAASAGALVAAPVGGARAKTAPPTAPSTTTSATTNSATTTTGGPPEWVAAGTRITHYYAVATVGSGSYELVEDPNGPLEDPVTGKRYRETFTAGVPTEGGTGSGDGYEELTVAAVDGPQVILGRASIANEPLTGTRSIGYASGERVATGATVFGGWRHPDDLAQLQSGAEMGRALVLRGALPVNGKEYQAVILVDPTPGNTAFFAYDSATGVQLTAALRILTQPGGPLQMGLTELREVRQLATAGYGAAVPAWLAAHPTLEYAGTQQFVNPMSPANPTVSPVTWRTTITESGATWALFQTNAAVIDPFGVAIPFTSSGAIGGAGPYWYDPAALGSLTTGQVLDTDPWTGYTLTVTAVGPTVTVSGTMDGMDTEASYDVATGVMTGQRVAGEASGITTAITLTAMPA